MRLPSQSGFTFVEITLVNREDNTDTLTVYLSDRAVLNDDEGPRYKPLLLDIRGIGNTQGDFLPVSQGASVILANSPGSFGFERRLVDLFEIYTPIQQTIKVYSAEIEANNQNVTEALPFIWESKIRAFQVSYQDQAITLNLDSSPIRQQVFSREINIQDYPNANIRAFSKHMPIVIGEDVEVRPQIIDNSDETEPVYAYAATLADDFVIGGVQRYGARATDAGVFVEITNPATPTTPVFVGPTPGNGNRVPISNEFAWANPFQIGGNVGILVTNFEAVIGPGNGEERLEWHIWGQDPQTGGPNDSEVLASSGPIDQDPLVNGVATTVPLPFQRFCVLQPGAIYFFGYTSSRDKGHNHSPRIQGLSGTWFVKLKNLAGSSSGGVTVWKPAASTGQMVFNLYGVAFTDAPSPSAGDINADGIGLATVSTAQNSVGQGNVSLDRLDLILVAEGMKDDGSGSITGAPNVTMRAPQDVAELLMHQYNGSAWVPGDFDGSAFSDTHAQLLDDTAEFYRELNGAREGRTTRGELLAEICENSQTRLVNTTGANTQLGLYAWGTTPGVVDIITDDDAFLIGYYTGDERSIVNNAVASYAKKLSFNDFTDQLILGGTRNYSKVLKLGYNDGGEGEEILAESAELYGPRELAKDIFNFVDDEQSMKSVLNAIVRQQSEVFQWVRFRSLYSKYKHLKPMDVVEVVFPGLPAFAGTSANPFPAVSSGQTTSYTNGEHLVRAKTYKAQIFNFNLIFRRLEPLFVEITAKLLISKIDPTSNVSYSE